MLDGLTVALNGLIEPRSEKHKRSEGLMRFLLLDAKQFEPATYAVTASLKRVTD
jgi:hypothetical protein